MTVAIAALATLLIFVGFFWRRSHNGGEAKVGRVFLVVGLLIAGVMVLNWSLT